MYRDNQVLFQTTIERNAGCWIAYNNLGLMLLQAGRAPEAKTRLERALALKPDDAEAHNNLGAALDVLGQHSAATEHYERATQLKLCLAGCLRKAPKSPDRKSTRLN